ncbi:elongator complex protein 3 [Patescibacteria group bacterium]
MIPFLLKLNPKTHNDLSQAKRKLASNFNSPIFTNSELLEKYHKYLKNTNTKPNLILLSLLKRRQVRTGSGVAPVAILTKPYPCPGKCIYCPNEKQMPKSYLSNEPAVMRAILNKFNPYKQIQSRLLALEANGHNTDKIELIIMGGTWSCLPKSYQLNYIIKCFKACNEFGNTHIPTSNMPAESAGQYLKKLQKQNENVKHRIVGLTLETRPDFINIEEIKRMREFGCTRVELGVQAIDDKILSLNKRGHRIKETINATKLLRQAGFKICYHLMLNLPGSNPSKDLKMFKEIFSNQNYQPDLIKIYPCVVTKNAPLYNWVKQGNYIPYSPKILTELIIKIKLIIPSYVRVIRVIRDIPTTSVISGNKISNLRENTHKIMAKRGLHCQCIRCREIGKFKIQNSKFKIKNYETSSGEEYFLSYEDLKQNKLLAFLRLQIPSNDTLTENKSIYKYFPCLKNSAIIREVHTYGTLVPINKRLKRATQHIGFGKKLIKKAEKIAFKKGYNKIVVIAGVGVREYYKKLGYKTQNTYMVKNLSL